MIEFWNTLSWPQAIVAVLLGIPIIALIFFIFGGEIHLSGETKPRQEHDINKVPKALRDNLEDK